MGLTIVITGNPVDGFRYIGPFKTSDEAIWWCERHPLDADWWIAPLEAQQAWDESLVLDQ